MAFYRSIKDNTVQVEAIKNNSSNIAFANMVSLVSTVGGDALVKRKGGITYVQTSKGKFPIPKDYYLVKDSIDNIFVSSPLDFTSQYESGTATAGVGGGGDTSGSGNVYIINKESVNITGDLYIDNLYEYSPDQGVTIEASVFIGGDVSIPNTIYVDSINEYTADNGVDIDGINITDGTIKADTIDEYTTDAGVTIDNILIKDYEIDVGANNLELAGNIFLYVDFGSIRFKANQNHSIGIISETNEPGWDLSILGGGCNHADPAMDGGDLVLVGGGQLQDGGGEGGDIYVIGGPCTHSNNLGGDVFIYGGMGSTRGNVYIGDGAANAYLPAQTTETDIIYYDTTTGKLSYKDFVSSFHFADNEIAYFGTGDDLKIYYSGSTSYIESVDHGANVVIRGEDAGGVMKSIFAGDPDSNAYMYYNGTAKISSQSYGAQIAGTAMVNGGDIIMSEAADHTSTPAAGWGILWVRNDNPCVLVFTDDAGTDHDLT